MTTPADGFMNMDEGMILDDANLHDKSLSTTLSFEKVTSKPQQDQHNNQSQINLQFPIGSRVLIHGLIHHTKLNDHLAVVEEYLTEQDRYKVRPIGRKAKLATSAKYVAVQSTHLRTVPPSGFVARIQSYATGESLRVPLICRIEWDPNTNFQWFQLRLLYSDFLGVDHVTKIVQEIEGPHHEWKSSNEVVFGVVSTPMEEEFIRGPLEGDELLILHEKPAIRDLYDAMVEYELLQELETTVDVGLHGIVNLCRVKFPYHVDQLGDNN